MIRPETPRTLLAAGDCVVTMAQLLDEASIDAIVTDPPYGLRFMGKGWDDMGHGNAQQAWHARWLREAFRVLKPGGHIVAFGGTRTYHRLVCAAEDVGFEIRDSLHWMYGSGFPKSMNVGKAIDKAAGAEREVVGYDASRARPNRTYEGGAIGNIGGTGKASDRTDNGATLTAPATPEAEAWEGWGTALKPGHEPILLARKPLIGTVAANVLAHGTGALDIDACRVATEDSLGGGRLSGPTAMDSTCGGNAWDRPWMNDPAQRAAHAARTAEKVAKAESAGRWPPNILLTHSVECSPPVPGAPWACVPECPVRQLDAQSDEASRFYPHLDWSPEYDAPFLYHAKAAKKEREAGRPDDFEGKRWNVHPTVKPVELMRWLVRLVTPPNGIVLDPFAGSGTTLVAAQLEGMIARGIEMDPAYVAIAERRIRALSPPDRQPHALDGPALRGDDG
jgi:DNA modification methylase